MGMKLYMVYGSPPVNAVLMGAKALKLDLELHELDIMEKKEHLEDLFLKINPAHTVPTLDDNGFIVWDSHAILCYLSEKYGENSRLYPNEVDKKARVHQMLNMDCGMLFRRFSDSVKLIFYENQKTVNPKNLEELKEAYSILERFLQSSQFLAADGVTIADISVMSTIMEADVFLPVIQEEFPNLKKWMTKLQGMDFYEAGEKGLETFRQGYKFVTGN